MRRAVIGVLAAVVPAAAHGQSVPNGSIAEGAWTAAQWESAWQSKLDVGGRLGLLSTTTDIAGVVLPMPAIADRTSSRVSVLEKGARCDGSTDDSAAFAAAISAAALAPGGGHVVEVPATGHSCVLKTGIVLGSATQSGVSLEGVAGLYWPGPYDNTEADWTGFGSWIRCDDRKNSCITLNGNGGHIRGLNFWYTQPTPPGAACGATCAFTHNWAPVDYPFTITVAAPQNFQWLSDITVVNGSRCLDVEGPLTGVGTIYMHIEHVHLGCFNTVLKMQRLDNTVTIDDFRDQIWWYQFSSDVVGYTEGDSSHAGHKIGWDFYYVSGLQASNVEFYQDWAAIRGTDQSVSSGLGTVTFAVQAGQWSNISFNQVCQAIAVAGAGTRFNARLSNVVLNVDPQTSGFSGQCGQAWPSAFNLASDYADVSISNLDGYTTQTLATVGGGNSGVLHLGGNVRASYSVYAPGAPGIKINNGAALDMAHDLNGLFPANTSAGPKVSGSPNWPIMGAGDIWVAGLAGTTRQQLFLTQPPNGAFPLTRWGLRTDGAAESGNNAGSNFGIDRYADSGAYVDSPIQINRSTGRVTLPDGVSVVLPTSCTGQATGTLISTPNAGHSYGLVGVCP